MAIPCSYQGTKKIKGLNKLELHKMSLSRTRVPEASSLERMNWEQNLKRTKGIEDCWEVNSGRSCKMKRLL